MPKKAFSVCIKDSVFIDPPYNTGNAFEYYDDNLAHSTWLSLIYPRLELLRELLSENGVLFVQIDDDEMAYMKVLLDEIMGRNNFVNQVSVKMKQMAGASGGGEDKRLKKNIEYILVYAKNYEALPLFNPVYEYTEMYDVVQTYKNTGKTWHYTSVLVDEGQKEYVTSTKDGNGDEIRIYKRLSPVIKSINQIMKDENITEKEVYYKYHDRIFEAKDAQTSIRTRVYEAKHQHCIQEDLISIEYVPKSGKNKGVISEQFYKGDKCRLFAWLSSIGTTIDGVLYKKDLQGTYWDFTQHLNNLTKEGQVRFPNGKKPEALVERVLTLATNEGDLVLDSFLGSGTTCAVAQKMGRRYIGIEMGEHAITHCVPRMKAVIDGEQGGISKAVNWNGGGGYTFYDLGETIFDENGNINKQVDFKTLASHIWFTETKTPLSNYEKSPLLGIHNGIAYYLLFNGILGDKKPDGGNVLTQKVFNSLPQFSGKKVIYGEATRMNVQKLKDNNIVFKQTPYDVKAR